MDIWFLHLAEDSQACSTKEKAIEAARNAIAKWPKTSNAKIINMEDNGYAVRVDYVTQYGRNSGWIYPYPLDGGSIC